MNKDKNLLNIKYIFLNNIKFLLLLFGIFIGMFSFAFAQDNILPEIPKWADLRYPNINYNHPYFEELYRGGIEYSGWWGIYTNQVPNDDNTRVVIAINISQHILNWDKHPNKVIEPFLDLMCVKKKAIVSIEYPVKRLDNNHDEESDVFSLRLQIDSNEFVLQRWKGLINDNTVVIGLLGDDALSFIDMIYDAKHLNIRIVGRENQTYDAVFDLTGGKDVYDEIKDAC